MANKLFYILIAILFLAGASLAQTASFTFQGKLNEGANAANGTYQFQFKLYDSNGVQIGQTLSDIPATVTNGIFAVNLDFGAQSFDGAARFVEIAVRPNCTVNCNGVQYTALSPRQAVASTPYAVKSLKSNEATTALTANDSLKLGNVPAANYTQNDDARLSDARTPTPNSTYYIQNGTNQQTASNFNISGEGKANVFNAATQFNIGGNRVFHLTGAYNTFVGFESGNSIAGGNFNAFFGTFAGKTTTSGTNNAFFGSYAGRDNLTGGDNVFFGQAAGLQNTTGNGNSLIGYGAGVNNLGGANNTFLGFLAGQSNTTENDNTFIGYKANGATGITNATAIGANALVTTSNTMVLGTNAVTVKVPGNFNVAGTFSANALDSDTVYKIAGMRVFHLTGTDNTFVGFESGNSITTGGYNAFFGKEAGKNNANGLNNTFVGAYAGRDNIAGTNNAFFGANAGLSNRGNFNSFFGSGAGFSNFNGTSNSFFGTQSGVSNESGQNNSFFGRSAGDAVTTGSNNTFVGALSGVLNTNSAGSNNIALGYNNKFDLGVDNSIAIGNNITIDADNRIVIGNASSFTKMGYVGATTVTATSIYTDDAQIDGGSITGLYEFGSSSGQIGNLTVGSLTVNSKVLFNDTLKANLVKVKSFYGGGSSEVCYQDQFEDGVTYHVLAFCSSSLRYKTDVQNYGEGLSLLKRLRPVTFNWKSNGQRDVGFVAEEINAAEPLLSTFNERGEVEGVKYAQITTVLVNAVKEQQTQIETQTAENQKLQEQLKQQQAQIDALKLLVCQQNPTAAVCAAPKEK